MEEVPARALEDVSESSRLGSRQSALASRQAAPDDSRYVRYMPTTCLPTALLPKNRSKWQNFLRSLRSHGKVDSKSLTMGTGSAWKLIHSGKKSLVRLTRELGVHFER